VNALLPLTVNGFTDCGCNVASLARRARWAAPTSIGIVPNALLNTTRTREPPLLTCTIWRSV